MRQASGLGFRQDTSQAVIRITLDRRQPPVQKIFVLRVVPTHKRPSCVKRAQPVDAHASKNVSRSCDRGAARAF